MGLKLGVYPATKLPRLFPSDYALLLLFLLLYIVAIGNWNFEMARKRIALSVDPEYHELLTKLADYQKRLLQVL